jgi:hypothetical protein
LVWTDPRTPSATDTTFCNSGAGKGGKLVEIGVGVGVIPEGAEQAASQNNRKMKVASSFVLFLIAVKSYHIAANSFLCHLEYG